MIYSVINAILQARINENTERDSKIIRRVIELKASSVTCECPTCLSKGEVVL